MTAKKTTPHSNPVETLKDVSSSIGANTVDSLRNLGTGILDQLLGINDSSEIENVEKNSKQSDDHKETKKIVKKEANLFNYQSHHENVIVRDQIQKLIEQIRQEVQQIKKTDSSLMNEVRDIEKFTLETLSEKPGIYHVKFLEIVLRILQSVRMKVGESKTWMAALMSKKKKR